MTRGHDQAAAAQADRALEPGRALDLAELAAYVDRVTSGLPDPQRADLAAALRRVWLRNRLPESIPSTAVCDVADHCALATIAALAGLGVASHQRVDPQPVTAWEEPAAHHESPVAGWSLS